MPRAVVKPALRQPDAARPAPERARIGGGAGGDLRAAGRRTAHQRQKAVRGIAGQDLQTAVVLQLAERSQQIAAPPVDEIGHAAKALLIVPGQSTERRAGGVATHLAVGQLAQAPQVPPIAHPQQIVVQHGGQRRRDRHGDAIGDALGAQPIESLQQRHVRFADGFEQPVLFQKVVVLRVTHERQVGVQDQRDVTGAHDDRSGAAEAGT
jgi:hypothetical protein